MSVKGTTESLISRLLFSVAAPAGVIVISLYIFNTLGDIKYLPASALAFGVGFFGMYLVFKYWVKTDTSQEPPRHQARRYLIIFIINVTINTEIVYLLVTYVGVPLLTAQMVAAIVIAYESYYAYRSLLYRERRRAATIQKPKKTEDDVIFYNDEGMPV